jgi:hypothetical protein
MENVKTSYNEELFEYAPNTVMITRLNNQITKKSKHLIAYSHLFWAYERGNYNPMKNTKQANG